MDLDRLLADRAFDLPVPPDGLARVDARARRIRRRRRLAVAAPLAVLVLAAGPSVVTLGAGGRSTDLAGPAPTRSADASRDPVIPVSGAAPDGTRERFRRMAERLDVVDAASRRLQGRCMDRKGFPYDHSSVGSPSEELSATRDLSVQQAQQRGYGIALRLAANELPVDANEAYLRTLSEADRAAWNAALGEGPPLTATFDEPFLRGFSTSVAGCSREAVEAIWGGAEEYGVATFVHNGPVAVLGQAYAHPDLVRLHTAWSRCMDGSGHAGLRTPHDAEGRVASAFSGDRQSARTLELELALADARCREEIDLDRRRTALEDRYLAGMVEQYPEIVSKVEQTLAAAQERAEAELAAAQRAEAERAAAR
jgi:hypothetical protein